jgi:hypothetical protein
MIEPLLHVANARGISPLGVYKFSVVACLWMSQSNLPFLSKANWGDLIPLRVGKNFPCPSPTTCFVKGTMENLPV